MWTLWTCLIVACFPSVWTMCDNSSFIVPVPSGELLDDGRLLDVQENVTYNSTEFFQERSDFWSCPCERQVCLFKCCPPKQELTVEENQSCAPARHDPIRSKIKLVHHNPCPGSKLRLSQSDFELSPEGRLTSTKFKGFVEPLTFCVDRQTDEVIIALVCEENVFSRVTSGTAATLAVPLLVFSIAIYTTTL